MSKSRTPHPVDWPALVDKYGPEYEEELVMFDDLVDELTDAASPESAGGALGGFEDACSALAILRGPEVARPVIERVAPAVPRIVAGLSPVPQESERLAASYTLAYLNAARCCGVSVGRESDGAEQRWLPHLAGFRAKLTEEECHTLAIASAAAGLAQAATEFAGLPRVVAFAPGVTHAFNVPAFAGYVASAVGSGASYDDVEPAWLDFVHRFPYKLATGMLKWPALLWAARAVYTTIGKLADDEVAAEVHRLVSGT